MQGHTTCLKGFRLLSPQEGILFKRHCKPPDKSGANSSTQHHFRGYKDIQGNTGSPTTQLETRWDIWGAPSASLSHCCPSMSSPGSKGMWHRRGQSHTVEYNMSMSTWKGKFYFPINWKHETHHSLSTTLALYIPLYREKNVWGSTASERWYDSPPFHGKADWICRLQVMSSAVEIQQVQPWLEKRVMGRN